VNVSRQEERKRGSKGVDIMKDNAHFDSLHWEKELASICEGMEQSGLI
jgi:hypothetical protein